MLKRILGRLPTFATKPSASVLSGSPSFFKQQSFSKKTEPVWHEVQYQSFPSLLERLMLNAANSEAAQNEKIYQYTTRLLTSDQVEKLIPTSTSIQGSEKIHFAGYVELDVEFSVKNGIVRFSAPTYNAKHKTPKDGDVLSLEECVDAHHQLQRSNKPK